MSSEGGQLFDPHQDFEVDEGARPHWAQAGTITFVTMRTADSIPREVIVRWNRQRLEYLRLRRIHCEDWRQGREALEANARWQFDKHFRRLREDHLDTCLGACPFRNRRAAESIRDALLHFDNERYLLGDFVVMPNHVHLLVAFPNAESMRKQCASWMRFTARQINEMNGSHGTLWQAEPFDHLVRTEDQLRFLREYIAQNPAKAKLPSTDYLYRRSNRSF
jgi:type I restriction enzyme R subunit